MKNERTIGDRREAEEKVGIFAWFLVAVTALEPCAPQTYRGYPRIKRRKNKLTKRKCTERRERVSEKYLAKKEKFCQKKSASHGDCMRIPSPIESCVITKIWRCPAIAAMRTAGKA